MTSYLKAKLTSWRKINVLVFTDVPRTESTRVVLYKNDTIIKKETITKLNSINHVYFFDVYLDEDYEKD